MTDETIATPETETPTSCPRAFSFFLSYWNTGKMMSDAQRHQLFDSMCLYVFEGITPTFADPTLAIAWTLVQPNLDASIRKSENGKKGGRPKTSKSSGKSKQKANEKQTESDTPFLSTPTPNPIPTPNPNPTPNPLHSYSNSSHRESGFNYNDTDLAEEDIVF